MAARSSPYHYFTTDPKEQTQVVLSEVFGRSYPGAFSATDIYALMNLPWGEVRPFGTLAAVSISTHRDVFPVTSMPYVAPRGFCQGHRTVAGTLMFNTIDRSAFAPTLDTLHKHPDELPLFDILFSYINEIGMNSWEQLIGVRILDFGKTVALENLQPIESYSFMALDYAQLKELVSRGESDKPFTLQRAGNRSQKKVLITERPDGASGASVDPALQDNAVTDPFYPFEDPASIANTGSNPGVGDPTRPFFGGP